MEILLLLLVLVLLVILTAFANLARDTISCYLLTPMRIKRVMSRQGVSGPPPRFLVGNILEVASLVTRSTSRDMPSIDHDIVARLLPHYVLWSKIYGKMFIYWNGSEPRLCLTDTDMTKELLGKYSMVSGKSWFQQQGSKNFVGKGVLMANGQDWYHQRHIVAPTFLGDKLKSYTGYILESTEKMLQSLESAVESGKSEVEIGEYMTALTSDIITQTTFGSGCENGKKIFRLLTRLQRLTARSTRHLWFPGSRFFPSKYNRETKSLKKEVERLLTEIIQSRKDCVEIGRSSSWGNDLLGTLLNEMDNRASVTKPTPSSPDRFNLDLQLIMDECKTIVFTGHESTALLLTWTAMLLAAYPSWQDKIREEVKVVCNGGPPSIEHLPKLALLSMVINESLRLYPPVAILPRSAFEDIRLGDLDIPKGLALWIPVLAIHHSEQLWGKDANMFNPERFASRTYAPGRFIPFALGPRNCVGQSFAITEAKMILSMLISRFSFTISENYRHAPVTVLTIRPKHGVQIHLTPLKPKIPSP
ncbi:hypothetical protein MLD38_033825 [Melastoma candidum]|uniref:Uncharacterized protein n=1 Tax=Melastoma candidum TaxID=119954 RepID=A0ACB9MAB0_9MYRT|nr:hypothetical protein MLD38_033825 [Melastoma candidum]